MTSPAGNDEVTVTSIPQNRKIVQGEGPAGEDGIYLEGEIYGQKLTMLLDTGSSVSLMSIETWRRLKGPNMKLQTTEVKLKGVGGQPVATIGRKEIPITIGRTRVLQEVIVGACQDGMILGIDFLSRHVSRLNFPDLKIHIGNEEIEMTYYNKLTERCRVLTYKTEIIPARSEKIIPVWPGAPRITGGILVDDPVLTNSDSGWLVAHALVEVKAGVLPARIINLTGNNLVFKEGSYVGYLESYPEPIPEAQPVRRTAVEDTDWTGYQRLRELAERATVDMARRKKA